jgi:magnesium transporter
MSSHHENTQVQLNTLYGAIGKGAGKTVRSMLRSLQPFEIAHLLESSPPPVRHYLWSLVPKSIDGEVLQELSDDIQAQLLGKMDSSEVVEITEGMDTDDLADVLQQLPKRLTQEVLASMSSQDRQRVEQVLLFAEDTAGGLMNTDIISVRPRLTLDVVFRYLRRHENLPNSLDNLIVVNGQGQYVGLLPLSKLLTSSRSSTVREVMTTDVEAIQADRPDHEVAKLFEHHDWVSAPVVDEHGIVLGRITIDDVVDVIREDADHSLMSMAGLDEEEDTFSPVMRTAPRRAIWLGINLLTAIIASSVINLFQDTIDKVVALAVLMPIVASMGGVAGSQTLTVVIRGMALGQVGRSNINWLMSRELRVGMLNGMLWALAMAAVAALWFQDPKIAIIIAAAMIINLLTAALAGSIIPIFLRSIRIDPALAGSVILTTVTDVVGFFAFLGLATYYYG